MLIVKYSSNGTYLWAKSVGGNLSEVGYSITTDTLGVYISGSFLSQSIMLDSDTLFYPSGAYDPIFLIKYDFNGNVLCSSALASGGDDNSAVATDNFGNTYLVGDFKIINPFIVGADTLTLTSGEPFFIAKYNCNSVSHEGINEFNNPHSTIEIYPNPTTTSLTIAFASNTKKATIVITDITGQLIYTTTAAESKQIEVNTSGFAEGMYFVQVKSLRQAQDDRWGGNKETYNCKIIF